MEVKLIAVVEDGYVMMELIVQLVRVVVVHQETQEVLQHPLKEFMDVLIVLLLIIICMRTYLMEVADLKKLKH